MRRALGFLSLAWMVALPGCRIEVTSLDAGSSIRVGNDTFSIELPPVRDWTVGCTVASLRLEHPDRTGFRSMIGKTVIEVSAHPLPAIPDCRSEEEMAREFLESERLKDYGLGPDFAPGEELDKHPRDSAKPLYGISYSAFSPKPSDHPVLGNHLSEVRREIYAYFPQGSGGQAFYSFDIIVARSSGRTLECESLRMIDRVIESFRVKSVPKESVPAPPNEVNP